MIKKVILLFSVSILFASFEEGKEIFKQKCSSCHSGYIEVEKIKDNFFNQDNKLLNLKAPSINMLVWAILDGPKKIGEEGDDFRFDEIVEYLTETLFYPDIQNSICDEHILKYYETKKSLKGKISLEEIEKIATYILEYKLHQNRVEKIKYHMQDLDKILLKAKKENKLIIVKATSPYCWFCKKMDKEVFDDIEVQKKLSKNFIIVEVNVDNYSLPFGLMKSYQNITPSFFVINGDKKLISSLPGSWSKEDFLDYLEENLEAVK